MNPVTVHLTIPRHEPDETPQPASIKFAIDGLPVPFDRETVNHAFAHGTTFPPGNGATDALRLLVTDIESYRAALENRIGVQVVVRDSAGGAQ